MPATLLKRWNVSRVDHIDTAFTYGVAKMSLMASDNIAGPDFGRLYSCRYKFYHLLLPQRASMPCLSVKSLKRQVGATIDAKRAVFFLISHGHWPLGHAALCGGGNCLIMIENQIQTS